MDAAAQAIAQHYKLRWQIELFFKWIKQNLQIKRFVGRSQNAVRIQILCALIAYLLLALERRGRALKCSMRELLAQLRSTLFQRPQLEAELARRRRQYREALLRLQPELPW